MEKAAGFGGELLEAGVRIAALGVKLAPLLLPLLAREPEPVENVLRRERPQLAERRQTFQKSIDALQSALGKASSELAHDAAGSNAAEHVKNLASALVAARFESALLEAEFDAWFTARFPEETIHYLYTEHGSASQTRRSAC